jgi:hypothetical protein
MIRRKTANLKGAPIIKREYVAREYCARLRSEIEILRIAWFLPTAVCLLPALLVSGRAILVYVSP